MSVCACVRVHPCVCLKQKDKKFTTITFLVHSIKMGFVRLECRREVGGVGNQARDGFSCSHQNLMRPE